MFDPEEDYTSELLDIPSVYKSHNNDSILIRLKDNKYNKTFVLRQSKKYHVTMSEYIQRCIISAHSSTDIKNILSRDQYYKLSILCKERNISISDFLKQSISNLLDKYDVTI